MYSSYARSRSGIDLLNLSELWNDLAKAPMLVILLSL